MHQSRRVASAMSSIAAAEGVEGDASSSEKRICTQWLDRLFYYMYSDVVAVTEWFQEEQEVFSLFFLMYESDNFGSERISLLFFFVFNLLSEPFFFSF